MISTCLHYPVLFLDKIISAGVTPYSCTKTLILLTMTSNIDRKTNDSQKFTLWVITTSIKSNFILSEAYQNRNIIL